MNILLHPENDARYKIPSSIRGANKCFVDKDAPFSDIDDERETVWSDQRQDAPFIHEMP